MQDRQSLGPRRCRYVGVLLLVLGLLGGFAPLGDACDEDDDEDGVPDTDDPAPLDPTVSA